MNSHERASECRRLAQLGSKLRFEECFTRGAECKRVELTYPRVNANRPGREVRAVCHLSRNSAEFSHFRADQADSLTVLRCTRGSSVNLWGAFGPRMQQLKTLATSARELPAGLQAQEINSGSPAVTCGRIGQPVFSACMSDVTRLLDAAAAGDTLAAADLLPLVYDELRRLEADRMAVERAGHTLDATALVHEAYLRLVGGQQPRTGTAGDTSSPRQPRPCAAFWLRAPVVKGERGTAATAGGWTWIKSRSLRKAPATTSSPWTTPSTGWRRRSRKSRPWSSCGTSSGSLPSRRPRPSASPNAPPTATGRTPRPGCSKPSAGRNRPARNIVHDSWHISRPHVALGVSDSDSGIPCRLHQTWRGRSSSRRSSWTTRPT